MDGISRLPYMLGQIVMNIMHTNDKGLIIQKNWNSVFIPKANREHH